LALDNKRKPQLEMIKRLLNLLKKGKKAPKPAIRNVMVNDEFSKKTLIGEDEEFKDMSDLAENFSENKEGEIETVFELLNKKVNDSDPRN